MKWSTKGSCSRDPCLKNQLPHLHKKIQQKKTLYVILHVLFVYWSEQEIRSFCMCGELYWAFCAPLLKCSARTVSPASTWKSNKGRKLPGLTSAPRWPLKDIICLPQNIMLFRIDLSSSLLLWTKVEACSCMYWYTESLPVSVRSLVSILAILWLDCLLCSWRVRACKIAQKTSNQLAKSNTTPSKEHTVNTKSTIAWFRVYSIVKETLLTN